MQLSLHPPYMDIAINAPCLIHQLKYSYLPTGYVVGHSCSWCLFCVCVYSWCRHAILFYGTSTFLKKNAIDKCCIAHPWYRISFVFYFMLCSVTKQNEEFYNGKLSMMLQTNYLFWVSCSSTPNGAIVHSLYYLSWKLFMESH